MAFIEIGFNTKRPLILGRGGFGTQLNDWLMDEGWGSADFLDDNAPDAVGGLRDYVDPAILKRGRPAFVALGDNKLRVELLQKLAATGYSTPVFISDAASVSPSAVLEPGCIILPQAYVGADAHLGVGCIVAFVVSLIAIKWLMGFVRRHDFKCFGVYRIILGVVVLAYFFVLEPMLGL